MTIIALVIEALCALGIILSSYIIIRNYKVHDFRVSFLDKGDLISYYKLPSYNKMIWSLKPLKLKYWIK